jgi:hypothetical protein
MEALSQAFAQEEKNVGSFELSTRTFAELVSKLEDELKAMSWSQAQLESYIHSRGMEVLRCLCEDYLCAMGEYESKEPVVGSDGIERTHHLFLPRNLETRFGTVQIFRQGYGHREASTLFPVDGQLNLPQEKYSYELQRLVCEEIAQDSYDETVGSVGRYTAGYVPKAQVGEVAVKGARDFDAFYQQRQEAAKQERDGFVRGLGDLLVLSTDGKGVVMRQKGLREETRKKAEQSDHKLEKRLSPGEKKNRKRMAMVGAVYTLKSQPRTPEDILGELHRTPHVRPIRPRPEQKRVWAKVVEGGKEVQEEVFREAQARDPHQHKQWVALVDGNESQLKTFQALALTYGVTLTLVVDLIHVIEYLWKAAWMFFTPGAPEAQQWVTCRLELLLQGKAGEVATGLLLQADEHKLEGKSRETVETSAGYLRKNQEFLRYDEYLTLGLPIATGVIEGACRYLVKDRMELTGARWGLEGADSVIKLRALRASGDFDEYWEYHQAREHERNHLSRYPKGVPELLPPQPEELDVVDEAPTEPRRPHLRLVT